MPAFIHVRCKCGRDVRAKSEQVGTRVRCWHCGEEVRIPVARTAGGELARACADAAYDVLRPEHLFLLVAGAVALAAVLNVPRFGGPLALAVMAVAAWFYQGQVGAASELAHVFVSGKEAPREDEADDRPAWARGLRLVARLALSGLAAAALVAPFLARNGGEYLPGARRGLGSPGWTAAAALGWLAVPLLAVLVNARDRRGPVSPVAAALGLARHPVATAVSLALFPLGLLLVELLVALVAAEQRSFELLIVDLFPVPETIFGKAISSLVFHYDGASVPSRFYHEINNLPAIYLTALGHGYTLVGAVPASLAVDHNTIRMDPDFYELNRTSYLLIRSGLAALIFLGAGLVLTVQARWLGLVATIDTLFLPSSGAEEPALATSRAPAVNGFLIETDAPPTPAIVTTATASAVTTPAPAPAPLLPSAPVPVTEAPYANGVTAAAPAFSLSGSGLVPSPAFAPAASATAVSPPPAPSLSGSGLVPSPTFAPGASGFAPALAAPPGTPTLLIIDDESAFSHALARILVGRGFAVLLANDATEGYQLALSAQPALIVLDLLLPDRPGMDLCRDLRAHALTRETPIIVATYKSGADEEVAGLALGADDFVSKPYVVEVLIARIQKQLERKRRG